MTKERTVLSPTTILKAALLAVLLPVASAAQATELVYVPTNPSFGGNPGNGGYLLNNAAASNKHKAPSDDFGFEQESALDRFSSNLQSQLLNDLLSESLTSGDNNQTLDANGFTVNINKNNGQLIVTITDKETGATSQIQLSNNN
ncbi:curli production assembly protein CsgF [Endozoicomonas sp. OPT23]|uniref:curli assembly protein CsgF n=1 Tax=Endozoicomonas sp. OPT23 TaxID=2072845 RepID=UPI00129AB368|nr:curli assembly protein CsgF [Endozoicomonas sp. OPT23]MRI33138.1 curli production assembly protein CsgF [Endozoicomonas sp. OPT23]